MLDLHPYDDEDLEFLERDAIAREEEALEVSPIRYRYEPGDHRTLHLELTFDVDGYWGGVPRAWKLTIEPMRSFYVEPLAALEARCQGETTGVIKKKLASFARGVLVSPKEILIATEDDPLSDAPRVLRFSQARGFLPPAAAPAIPRPRTS